MRKGLNIRISYRPSYKTANWQTMQRMNATRVEENENFNRLQDQADHSHQPEIPNLSISGNYEMITDKPIAGIPTTRTLKSFLFCLSLAALLLYNLETHRQETAAVVGISISGESSDLRMRAGYKTYDEYISRQLNKTLNPKLRKIWTTRDWQRKVGVFSEFFQELKTKNFLTNDSKALCIGARVGQEVVALRGIGVNDSVGIDLVPFPPLVLAGDFHNHPFENETFDFEFSNVFDHALFPAKFVSEIERTLKPGGVCVLHVSLKRRGDKYSANDLFSVKPLIGMFKNSVMVRVRSVDGFGLDTEIIFRKKETS